MQLQEFKKRYEAILSEKTRKTWELIQEAITSAVPVFFVCVSQPELDWAKQEMKRRFPNQSSLWKFGSPFDKIPEGYLRINAFDILGLGKPNTTKK